MTYAEMLERQRDERIAFVKEAIDLSSSSAEAARLIGMSRQQFHKLQKSLGAQKTIGGHDEAR